MRKENYKIIKSLNNYKISPNDRFFFDTNIWIFLLNEHGEEEPHKYSAFLNKILEKNAHIVVNQELVSEILNRITKNDFDKHFKNSMGYKEYRRTDSYRQCYRIICALFEQLLSHGTIVFVPIDISQDEFLFYIKDNTKEKHKPILDYKDYLYDIFAKKNDLILVTNDGDFGGMKNVKQILSANPKLIDKKIYN